MNTHHEYWSIRKLTENLDRIEYPEFQREPTVWNLEKKQRLIDSILREFDISSIYFYKKNKEGYDCIDGRQRINAISSYLGLNGTDLEDNIFHLKMENEIYSDGNKFKGVDKRFENLEPKWKEKILNYKMNIVVIEDVEEEKELNLLFIRLQIATVLNAGEKLHAMLGEMHNKVFYNISQHEFFNKMNIPSRRYYQEIVASQIAINVFSKKYEESFHRARYIDLQDFFKQHTLLNKEDHNLIKFIDRTLSKMVEIFGDKIKIIKNRAIAVSVFLFCYELLENNLEKDLPKFIRFLELFLKTLKWQMKKGVLMDSQYYDLLKFQTNITQAAAEKTAIEKRHDFLKEYFYHYCNKHEEIKGDAEYKKSKGDPSKERKSIKI